MSILFLLLIPVIIAGAMFLYDQTEITPGEFLLQIMIQSILICGIYSGVRHWQMQDTEVWNGRVVKKDRQQVHCRHSYQCNCVTMSCGKDCSMTVCSTCYDHSYDVDWTVYNNLGEDFRIETTDRQGLNEPAFWTRAKPGDTTATPHEYTNYIKNSSQSLFNKGDTKESYHGYPLGFYNYYNLNRFIDTTGTVQDADAWNLDISSVSADLGRTKQVNVVVYLTKDKPRSYFDGLNRSWSGAKKNDVAVVINMSSNTISWVDTMALVKDEYLRVKLRDDILAIGSLDRQKIMAAIRSNIQAHYVRRPMKDFEYLLSASKLSTGDFVLALFLSIVVSLMLTAMFKSNSWRKI